MFLQRIFYILHSVGLHEQVSIVGIIIKSNGGVEMFQQLEKLFKSSALSAWRLLVILSPFLLLFSADNRV